MILCTTVNINKPVMLPVNIANKIHTYIQLYILMNSLIVEHGKQKICERNYKYNYTN